MIMSRFDHKAVYPRVSWATGAAFEHPVDPLPPAPERVKKVIDLTDAKEAIRVWDTAMVVSDGDRVLADRAFDAARKTNRRKRSTP